MRATPMLLLMLTLGLCTGASADVPAVQIECWTGGGDPVIWMPRGVENGDGTYTYQGQYNDADGHWEMDYGVTARPDPFVSAVFGLTNTSPSVQNFTLIVTLPISPAITPSSLIGGSTAGSINDANYDGVGMLATLGAGRPFYYGQIDGVGVLPLLPDPFSVTVPFAGGTANIPAVSAGLPGPTVPGPAALSSIGIMHEFSLTPGDTVAITSFFVAVPEPATVLLVVLGALALRRR